MRYENKCIENDEFARYYIPVKIVERRQCCSEKFISIPGSILLFSG